MKLLAILGIALANNLDNTGVGIALGIARIRLSPLVNLWIALVTFAVTGVAAACGGHAASFLPVAFAHALGGALLCAMGVWMLLPSLRPRTKPPDRRDPNGPVSVRRILSDPACADWNQSHDIDLREATLLAVALSLNNLGGGFSAGLMHLGAVWTAVCSGVVSFLVLWFGGWAGLQLNKLRLGKGAQLVAGMLLLLLGLCQFH